MDQTGLSLHKGSIGGPGKGGSFTKNVANLLEEGSGYTESLSVGAVMVT
jgi:hypothetical protein